MSLSCLSVRLSVCLSLTVSLSVCVALVSLRLKYNSFVGLVNSHQFKSSISLMTIEFNLPFSFPSLLWQFFLSLSPSIISAIVPILLLSPSLPFFHLKPARPTGQPRLLPFFLPALNYMVRHKLRKPSRRQNKI
ncbi:uncharacterized protein BP01DRAFT_230124 [Aspergillus saccharolyticus JOP 1030-1]|uniref:Uncharacterized protein n=1 Tax=Aspergillus saccharolyticus JOP 1030-1 TaxID=1450539 RepID=A0A318ZI64_9EURO|nr:hypothetical protein BP01DRAFT_230124 [Aspergillus saccharolyticus JOP 1030-1]PYH47246.1 hypothetical protein BP01DRAFT_230124 [Aspergillus saccharolyticus JOP 1030-1]